MEVQVKGSALGLVSNALQIMMPGRAYASCISFAAGLVIGGHFGLGTALMGALWILSTYSSQAVYNNILDMEGDRINAPQRPLARGTLSVRFARLLMAALIILGFIFSYLTAPPLVLVNVIFIILGMVYSSFTKGMGLLSYITLTTTHFVLPLASAYAVFNGFDGRLAAIAAFIYVSDALAFSLKDYKDVYGDRRVGVRTLPVALSPRKAARLTFAGLCMPLFLSWIPWMGLHLSIPFIVLFLASGIGRLMLGIMLLNNPSPRRAEKILNKFRYFIMLQMVGWCFS